MFQTEAISSGLEYGLFFLESIAFASGRQWGRDESPLKQGRANVKLASRPCEDLPVLSAPARELECY